MGTFRVTITGRSEDEVAKRVADSLKSHPEYRIIVEPKMVVERGLPRHNRWVAVVGY